MKSHSLLRWTIPVFILLVGHPSAFAVNTEATGYLVPANGQKVVSAHSTCKLLRNPTSKAVFVLTKTAIEWSTFQANVSASTISITNDCPITCDSLLDEGNTASGVYTVDPD